MKSTYLKCHDIFILLQIQVCFLVEVDLTLFSMGLFGTAHGCEGQKGPAP